MDSSKPVFFLKKLRYTIALAFTTLIWVIAVVLVAKTDMPDLNNLGDLATLLFGASSVALFVLSFFVGILAIFGWQTIQGNIREAVADTTNKKVEQLTNEMRGRVLSGLGYMVGEMGLVDPVNPDKDRLAVAEDLCRQGYDYLSKVKGAPEYLGLNNLVFYSFAYGDPTKRDFLLKKARMLMEAAHEHGSTNLQLTAGRVLLAYGTPEEKDDTINLLRALTEKPGVSEQEKKEARRYLKPYDAELR